MVDTQDPKFWKEYTWSLQRLKEERKFFLQMYEIEKLMKDIQIQGKRIDSLLVVGCGSGRFFPFYVPYSNYVLAVDLAPDRVDNAWSYAKYLKYDNILIECMNFLDNKFEDDSFDVVVCLDVLLHIPHNLIDKFISELVRTSKKHIIIASWYHSDIESLIERNAGRTNLRGQYFIHDYPRIFKSLGIRSFGEKKIFDEQYLFWLVKETVKE